MYSDFNIEEFTQQLQNDCSKAQTKKFDKNDENAVILKEALADFFSYSYLIFN